MQFVKFFDVMAVRKLLTRFTARRQHALFQEPCRCLQLVLVDVLECELQQALLCNYRSLLLQPRMCVQSVLVRSTSVEVRAGRDPHAAALTPLA